MNNKSNDILKHQPRGAFRIRIGQLFRPCWAAEASEKYFFKRQLHTTHVGAVRWEPPGNFPTACAGKEEQP